MTTNHIARAEALLRSSEEVVRDTNGASAEAAEMIAEAQARATIALAEQQRIANLIALAHRTTSLDEELTLLSDEAAFALMRTERIAATPFSGEDEIFSFRDEIASALGIDRRS